MEREMVLDLLRMHIGDLTLLGVRSLALFGSLARDEATPESDVYLVVNLEAPYTFDRYIRVKFYLEDLLGRPVDLVMAETLKPRALKMAQQEAIHVA